jgi:replicative DNA helicase
VLALAQMNRDVESRQGGKPRMSDLKGSGAIEQDSDQIWFIGRNANGATLWIEKNRAGPAGELSLAFDGERTAFSDKP